MFNGVVFARSSSIMARAVIVLLLVSGLCPSFAFAALKVSGTPATSAVVGQKYSFQPSVSYTTSQAPTYSIANKPGWATFSTTTGRLSGVPTQTGISRGILIHASTTYTYASLPAFNITVTKTQAPVGGGGSGGTTVLSAANYSLQQNAGAVRVTVMRTGGSSGAASVHYATANGTAMAGRDYTAASGAVSWASGDSSAKTVSVAISNATPYTGTRNFKVALSSASGSALGTPASSMVTVVGDATDPPPVSAGPCAKNSSSWTTTGAFDSKAYGDYFVNNNNWGGTPGQQFWSNDENCWGVTTSATSDRSSIGSYPSVTRGWSQNATIMQQQGGNSWTVKSGMGIPVSQLTKAKVHWSFNAPTTSGIRWLGLMDNYFHSTNSPSPSQFPPVVDLMVDQSIADQVVNGSTYYALVAQQDHGSTVTISGVQYVVYIDDSDESAYHSAGGHTIHLFRTPSAFTSGTGLAIWGTNDGVTDLAAIVKFFMKSNPVDDNGQPLKTASGLDGDQPADQLGSLSELDQCGLGDRRRYRLHQHRVLRRHAERAGLPVGGGPYAVSLNGGTLRLGARRRPSRSASRPGRAIDHSRQGRRLESVGHRCPGGGRRSCRRP